MYANSTTSHSVLVVPTVNIRDCPPFKIEIDPRLDALDAEKVESLWQQAQQKSEQPKKAKRAIENLLKIDPQHAGAHYYLGQFAIAEQNWESAKYHLNAAKDFDVCPLRATTEILKAVRDVANENGVLLLDADQLFQTKCPHALVGRPWLIDHVHPGIEGHQLLGEAIADSLLKNSWIESSGDAWRSGRPDRYRNHLSQFGEEYFFRGQQRLEGLLLWTQGRAKEMAVPELSRDAANYRE